MSGLRKLRITVAVMGVVFAGGSAAQLPSNGGNNLPSPRTQTASCNEVAWEANLLRLYPRIGFGCQEIFFSEGQEWARFEAYFVGLDHRSGLVTLDFKNRNSLKGLERITLQPAANQRVTIDGRSYRLTELMRGERLNLYLPARIFAGVEAAPLDQLAEIVVVAEVL
jgi:hypothetical protein